MRRGFVERRLLAGSLLLGGLIACAPPPPATRGVARITAEPKPAAGRVVHRQSVLDEERVYLLGVSKGGGGAWHLALTRPELWAGIAPMTPSRYAGTRDLTAIAHLPVLLVQGERDTAVSVSENRRVAAAMERMGMRSLYLEIPGAGHDLSEFEVMDEVFRFFEATAGAR